MITRRVLLAADASTVGVLAVPGRSEAASPRVDTLLEWYDHTAETVGVITGPQQITNSRTWAVSWIAAWRAVTATRSELALAGAVHETLVSLNPAAAAALDAALAATVARVGGRHPDRALRAGADAARAVLVERAGDGLDLASVNRPFTPPPPAPGIWQPTPPAFAAAVQAGQGDGGGPRSSRCSTRPPSTRRSPRTGRSTGTCGGARSPRSAPARSIRIRTGRR